MRIKFVILIVALLLVSGCRTVKQYNSETRTETDVSAGTDYKMMYENQLDVNMQLEQRIAVLTDENVKLSSEINTHEIEYDTDKPVDPVTNNPPKKKETFQSNKQDSERKVTTSISEQSNLNTDIAFYMNMAEDLQTELTTTQKDYEVYKSSIKNRMAVDVWWFWMLVGIVISIVISLVFPKFPKFLGRLIGFRWK